MEPIQAAITGMECAESNAPLGALSEFYRAFNNRNLDLMRKNWHPEECVLNNPLGGYSTWVDRNRTALQQIIQRDGTSQSGVLRLHHSSKR